MALLRNFLPGDTSEFIKFDAATRFDTFLRLGDVGRRVIGSEWGNVFKPDESLFWELSEVVLLH